MILVASDDPSQLDEFHLGGRFQRYLKSLKLGSSGIKVLGVIRGETRVDDVGHEHFGFKDGVSQPGVRGVEAPDDGLHNPNQGNPGQDLLHPGEFVLGYPRQIPLKETGVDGPNTCQGAKAGKEFYASDPADSKTELPDWAVNGSFLVFRRLAQDVKGFRDAVDNTAYDLGITPDLLGAKIVGRFRSGAPLEPLRFQDIDEYKVPLTDPGIAHPALAGSDDVNNYFEYGDDKEGKIVPLASHIRKAYPRDQVATHELGMEHPEEEGGAESRTQTHRLLRRGIPFGNSLGAAHNGGVNDARGLLFVAYQTDIERQFEFVQQSWVNDSDFPQPGAGQDPIIANSTPAGPISGCPFHQSANAAKCPVTFKHFVKTRGGGYFFSPSIDTLATWLGV
jgi:Dyp-type peroxidase family